MTTTDLPSHLRPVVIDLLREVLAGGRDVTLIVRGNSMIPTLKEGDRVTVVPSELSELQPGELLAYVGADYEVVTHRLVSLDGDFVVTRGDNRAQHDSLVHVSRVLGKVVEWTSGSE